MFYRFAGAVIGIVALGSMIQPALSQEPIKIGVMFPLTGPISAQGGPERDAIKQAFDAMLRSRANRDLPAQVADAPPLSP